MLASMTTRTPTRVLAIALQKGGVGKTTTAINLSTELSALGLKVLLIDIDQQANATKGLGITLDGDDATMYEVLHEDRAERVPLSEVIKTSVHGPDVAPAALALRKLERTGLGAGGQARLAREIAVMEGRYDIVVIDCPPSLGELTTAAIAAADSVLATVAPGPDELEALVGLENTVLDVQESLNPKVELNFVLITNFDGRTQLAKDVKENVERDWSKEYLGEISSTIRVGEAKFKQVPIAVHAPGSKAASDYQRTAQQIAERMKLNG
ncbi:ParA family protein [Rhodococcoides fascians]|uniref:ParA family protein n=1 Tax=Rhodococcoides fascians TaxID=1828 RepID=UPI000AF69406|nr:ParA family protein [Rhodococcus fascians]